MRLGQPGTPHTAPPLSSDFLFELTGVGPQASASALRSHAPCRTVPRSLLPMSRPVVGDPSPQLEAPHHRTRSAANILAVQLIFDPGNNGPVGFWIAPMERALAHVGSSSGRRSSRSPRRRPATPVLECDTPRLPTKTGRLGDPH